MLRATQGTGTDAAVDLVGSGPYARNAGTRFYYAGPVYQQPWSDGCVGFGARITSPTGVVYDHQSANPAIGWGSYCG